MSELGSTFDAIEQHYKSITPEIMACPSDEWAVSAYAWDTPYSGISLSPIEHQLWCDIRQLNMVMYPQYPVGRYFVDFANPVAKVAIECDGAAYHGPNRRARDQRRQREIEDMGWSVYRISGSACAAVEQEIDDGESFGVKPSVAVEFLKRVASNHKVCRSGMSSKPTGVLPALADGLGAVLSKVAA